MKARYRSTILSLVYTSLFFSFVLIIFVLAVTEWKLPGEISVKGEIEISGIILALATIVLVMVTWVLARATTNLVKATEALVFAAKYQSEWDKRRATSDEWHRLRVSLGFPIPNLKLQRDEMIKLQDPTYDTSLSEEEKTKIFETLSPQTTNMINKHIRTEGRKIRDYLRDLEYFAGDVNNGDLDIKTFLRRSRNLFIEQYEHASPYINMRHQRRSSTYAEICQLYTTVRREG